MSRNSRCKLSQQVCSESDLLDLYDEEERASGGKLKAIEKNRPKRHNWAALCEPEGESVVDALQREHLSTKTPASLFATH